VLNISSPLEDPVLCCTTWTLKTAARVARGPRRGFGGAKCQVLMAVFYATERSKASRGTAAHRQRRTALLLRQQCSVTMSSTRYPHGAMKDYRTMPRILGSAWTGHTPGRETRQPGAERGSSPSRSRPRCAVEGSVATAVPSDTIQTRAGRCVDSAPLLLLMTKTPLMSFRACAGWGAHTQRQTALCVRSKGIALPCLAYSFPGASSTPAARTAPYASTTWPQQNA